MSKTTGRVLHLISQAHLDPVWLWPLRDGVAEGLTTMQSAVDRCRETPQFKFTRSSASVYQWARRADPRLFAEIKSLVQAGRWEVVGGWVEQPDCNLPSGESFLRQALYGREFFEKNLGPAGRSTIGYNVDSFGHGGGLPQLLRLGGLDTYAFQRPGPADNPSLPMLFWWESADGSRVLAVRIPGSGYSQSYAATADDIEREVRAACQNNFMQGFDHGVMWFGGGNHGGGPTREHIARVLRLQGEAGLPEIRFSTLREFALAVRSTPAAADLPVVRGELGYVFRGCYAATGATKQQHRSCEKRLFAAESVICNFDGAPVMPARLRRAWWNLLFSQFHDILAGTCVDAVQGEIADRFSAVMTTAGDSILESSFRAARRVDTSGEKGSVVFAANPLPWARQALVSLDTFVEPHGREKITGLEAPDGTRLPIQWLAADANFGPWALAWGKLTALVPLPASGYRVFRVLTEPVTGDSETGGPARIDASGDIQFSGGYGCMKRATVSLGRCHALDSWRLGDATELLSAPVGTVVLEDVGGTWGHGISSYDKRIGMPELVGSELLEDGPLVTIIRQKSVWDRSEIWMDIVRCHHLPVIELRLRFNWQQQKQQLKLEIPTRLSDTRLLAKMPGETVAREADGSEWPCHDWVVMEGRLSGALFSLGLANDSSYSHDAQEGVLRMVLARGVPPAELAGLFYDDTSNVAFLDQGWQQRRFFLTAGAGAWKSLGMERLAQDMQVPAVAFLDSAHPGDWPREATGLEVSPPGVAVMAVKPSEQHAGSMVIRLQENEGQPAMARLRFPNGEVNLPLAPWEIAGILRRPDGSWSRVDATETIVA